MPGAYHSWDFWSKGLGLWRILQEIALAELGTGKHKGNTWMVGSLFIFRLLSYDLEF